MPSLNSVRYTQRIIQTVKSRMSTVSEKVHRLDPSAKRCHGPGLGSRSGPGVVVGSQTMQISNITDAISKFVHITHECMDSKKLII